MSTRSFEDFPAMRISAVIVKWLADEDFTIVIEAGALLAPRLGVHPKQSNRPTRAASWALHFWGIGNRLVHSIYIREPIGLVVSQVGGIFQYENPIGASHRYKPLC